MVSQFFSRISASPVLKFSALVLATTIASTALLPVSSASAGKRNDVGAAIALGVVGLAVGSLLVSSSQRRYKPRPRPEPVYVEPPLPYYEEYSPRRGYQSREPRPQPYYKHNNRRHRHNHTSNYQPRDQYPNTNHRKSNRIKRHTVDKFDAPRVITYNETSTLEPWSPGWKNFCGRKYRSFNSKSGTYLGYDGNRHFCVVK